MSVEPNLIQRQDALGPISTGKYIDLAEQTNIPATPKTNQGRFYLGSDGRPYVLTDGGILVPAHKNEIFLDPMSSSLVGAGSLTTYGTSVVLVCNYTGVAGAQLAAYMPKGLGSQILYGSIFWAPNSTGAGNVVWQWSMTRVTEGAVMNTANDASASVTAATPGATGQVVKSTLSIAGVVIENEPFLLRITRNTSDAADTYGSIAYLLAFVCGR